MTNIYSNIQITATKSPLLFKKSRLTNFTTLLYSSLSGQLGQSNSNIHVFVKKYIGKYAIMRILSFYSFLIHLSLHIYM